MVTTDVVDVSLIDVESESEDACCAGGEYAGVCAHAVHTREHENRSSSRRFNSIGRCVCAISDDLCRRRTLSRKRSSVENRGGQGPRCAVWERKKRLSTPFFSTKMGRYGALSAIYLYIKIHMIIRPRPRS